MAFMNAKKRNKTITYIIVVLISVGLLATTLPIGISAIGSYITGDSGNSSGSLEDMAGQDFVEAESLWRQGKKDDAGKKFASAIKGFEEILKRNPNTLNKEAILINLGESYFYTGNTDKAIELARKALEIKPDYSIARINLAIYLFEGKNSGNEAIRELQKIPADDSYYQTAQQLMTLINQKE